MADWKVCPTHNNDRVLSCGSSGQSRHRDYLCVLVGLNVARKGACALLAAQRGKKSTKKTADKKARTSRRVQAERADAFRRGVNAVVAIVIVLFILFGALEIWLFLGKPGWPIKPRIDRTICLELYFHDNSVTYLVPVHRRVTLAPNDDITIRAVQEFAKGPEDPYLAGVYPDGIPLPAVQIDGRVAMVDLPAEVTSHLGGTARERDLLDALTLTVAAAGECDSVRILVGGEAVEATSEGYDLTAPLEPPAKFNFVPDSALMGESKWVTAYFLDSSGRYLLPLSLEVAIDAEDANEAVERLLRLPPQLAYPPPMPVAPEGYSLERLIIENGAATVDVGVQEVQTAFPDQTVAIFRRAVYLTLKDCCGVSDVKLELNGRDLGSYGRFGDQPPESEECWNLERSPEEAYPQEPGSVEVGYEI